MLVNLFVFWILVSVFFGGREANRAIGKIFGFLAFFWAMGLILRIGFGLLPVIILVAIFSKVIVPFFRGFFSIL